MIRIKVNMIMNVSLPVIWNLISDFNGLPAWHPAAAESYIEPEKDNGVVGCVRNFALADGSGRVRETLLAISLLDHSVVYDMLDAPLPFVDYISTMQFEPITNENKVLATWSAEFSVSDGDEVRWEKFVRDDVFIAGFKALEEASLKK